MRIAHLSDLHLAIGSPRSTLRNSRRLLEEILRLNVDHVVVTGDITADGSPEELAAARALFATYGLLDGVRLTLIPGNHDIYGGVRDAEDVLVFPERCRMTDTAARRAAFHEAFAETFTGAEVQRVARAPFMKTIGSVTLIGVDSVAPWSRMRNPLGSNGRVEEEELRLLEEMLALPSGGARARLVLVHHHFRKSPAPARGALAGLWSAVEAHTMKLRGKKSLLRLFRRSGVDMVLHGHLHENSGYTRGGVRFLNGGGSLLGPLRGRLSFNLLTVGREGVRAEIRSVPAAPPSSRRRTFPPLLRLREPAAAA